MCVDVPGMSVSTIVVTSWMRSDVPRVADLASLVNTAVSAEFNQSASAIV